MSVIQTNARGVDLVELEFYTKGSNQAHLVSRDNLVDATKDYVFGVSELLVPNSSLPIFKPGTTQELFRIKKRFLGAGNTTFADIEVNGDTLFDSTFGINDTRKFFSIPIRHFHWPPDFSRFCHHVLGKSPTQSMISQRCVSLFLIFLMLCKALSITFP